MFFWQRRGRDLSWEPRRLGVQVRTAECLATRHRTRDLVQWRQLAVGRPGAGEGEAEQAGRISNVGISAGVEDE